MKIFYFPGFLPDVVFFFFSLRLVFTSSSCLKLKKKLLNKNTFLFPLIVVEVITFGLKKLSNLDWFDLSLAA